MITKHNLYTVTFLFRVYAKFVSENFKQILMSWVTYRYCLPVPLLLFSLLALSLLSLSLPLSPSLPLSLSFSLQHVFMFQWPKLPELALSMGDYSALTDCFTTPPMVGIYLRKQSIRLQHI